MLRNGAARPPHPAPPFRSRASIPRVVIWGVASGRPNEALRVEMANKVYYIPCDNNGTHRFASSSSPRAETSPGASPKTYRNRFSFNLFSASAPISIRSKPSSFQQQRHISLPKHPRPRISICPIVPSFLSPPIKKRRGIPAKPRHKRGGSRPHPSAAHPLSGAAVDQHSVVLSARSARPDTFFQYNEH